MGIRKFYTLSEYYKTKLLTSEGVYILSFKNGKHYLGRSMDLGQRIKQHLSYLQNPEKSGWYSQARIENRLTTKTYDELLAAIEIKLCPCSDSVEYEAELLQQICDNNQTDNYYNTKFTYTDNEVKGYRKMQNNLCQKKMITFV